MSNIYTPYTYRITSKTAGQHYYGVRYAEKDNCLYESGCHPDELWITYFTSSKLVKELIEKYGKNDFIVEIRKRFPNAPEKALLWEKKVLTKLGVLHRNDWLNRYVVESIIVPWNKGLKNPYSKETTEKRRESNLGQKRSLETRKKISDTRQGKKLTEAAKEKLRIYRTGKKLSRSSKKKLSNGDYILPWSDEKFVSAGDAAKNCPVKISAAALRTIDKVGLFEVVKRMRAKGEKI